MTQDKLENLSMCGCGWVRFGRIFGFRTLLEKGLGFKRERASLVAQKKKRWLVAMFYNRCFELQFSNQGV